MDSFGHILIFVLFGLFVVGALIYSYYQAQQRREAWLLLATELGCQYSSEDSYALKESTLHDLFQKGHSRRVSNVLSGKHRDRDLKCFDYRYTTGSGKNQQTHCCTCLLLTPPLPFQPLWIRPESFLDELGSLVGVDDIDFESHEFSKRFYVKCGDRKFAYDILHGKVMELLLRHPPAHIEARMLSLLIYYPRHLTVPQGVRELIELGCDFLDLIPAYLLNEWRPEKR